MNPGRRSAAVFTLAAVVAVGGCTTLGSHVKGSFSCQAPEGICAPSSTIDDRALAMIAGDQGAAVAPAGPFVAPTVHPRPTRTAAVARPLASAGNAQRTGEKVLRVVFQPYVDDYGRLHEASVVRTVVRGEWQAAAAVPAAVRAVDPAMAGSSLAEAVERADPPGEVAGTDPDLPSAAAVAAARAKVDPVASIRADVAKRLAARAVPAPAAAGGRGATPGRTAAATAPASPVPAIVRASTTASQARPEPTAMTAANAAARIRNDPRVAAAGAAAQAGGRQDRVPPTPQPGQPVMRATSFPGTDPEEN